MKFTNLLPVILALTTETAAYWRGFNIGGYQKGGIVCKTKADWATDFIAIHQFPNKINSIRLYSSYGCSTLANALPYAIKTDTKIVVGINPLSNYALEKKALLNAINTYGWGWIASISVGNENLYRNEISPQTLAAQIYDVRGMIKALPGYTTEIKVGHVDTGNAWSNISNKPVILASDFIGTAIYPYFQSTINNSIANAAEIFREGVSNAQKSVAKAGGKAPVWVTETGWPTNGPTKGLAVPSLANAQKYWKAIGCTAYYTINTYWFTLQDFATVPSFGVIGPNNELLYDQTCP